MTEELKLDWQAQFPIPFDVVKCNNGYFALAASNGRPLTWTVPPGSSDVAAMTYIAACTNQHDALRASHDKLLTAYRTLEFSLAPYLQGDRCFNRTYVCSDAAIKEIRAAVKQALEASV